MRFSSGGWLKNISLRADLLAIPKAIIEPSSWLSWVLRNRSDHASQQSLTKMSSAVLMVKPTLIVCTPIGIPMGECTCAAQGAQIGRAGPGADEDDASHGAAPQRTSSAPLVRWLAGSTTIKAPPTRLLA